MNRSEPCLVDFIDQLFPRLPPLTSYMNDAFHLNVV